MKMILYGNGTPDKGEMGTLNTREPSLCVPSVFCFSVFRGNRPSVFFLCVCFPSVYPSAFRTRDSRESNIFLAFRLVSFTGGNTAILTERAFTAKSG